MKSNVQTHVLEKNNLIIPFYVNNHYQSRLPEYSKAVDLNPNNLPGIPLVISGSIYSKNKEVVPNAKIEIWHSTDASVYQNEGNFYFPSQKSLSGSLRTNKNGVYSVKTIRPGVHGYRARHLHYKISAKGYRTLETQIYFKDDPRILIDETAMVAEHCRIINFSYNQLGVLQGTVDIFLPKV
ncbi:hypothetical protein [Aquimarina litoralis]|uniref:dioxygenase family protein n=1 Tax=Aquimarina litoralis TaxID=584605 RepID=UPI001C562CE5|nr:hypothetical protein [Aquimarina litoralis]MBW1298966.1 hypothetical protein [Aquimarina litoralis]